LFSALIAVGAFIQIPIPILPFTLQVLFTTLAGLLLGPRLGAMAVATYIIIGLIGIPVFTKGGGLSYIFQPTFGYIIGFFFGSMLTGYLAHKKQNPSFKSLLTACFAGLCVVYACGTVYYYFMANYYINEPIGVWGVFIYCFVLCVPGDILLCFIASHLAKRLLPVLKIRGLLR
ncbi:MAG: biotin transporter BioY, partial [Turicibacter sp.]